MDTASQPAGAPDRNLNGCPVMHGDFRALAKAITAGHAQQARSVMEQHIEVIARYHRDAHAARMDDFIEWQ